MLARITIQNFLLIDKLELDLRKGFTAITGETGSGKSILIGALGLAMGDRAEASATRDATKRCVIELEVEAVDRSSRLWLSEQGIDDAASLILRRQIEPGGRSRAFVNDTPVRLEQLRELGERLVHVHSQHHTLLLNDAAFQLSLVDHMVGEPDRLERFRTDHQAWKRMHADLEALRAQQATALAEADFARFQLDELDTARLVDGELPRLEQELLRAENAQEIIAAYQAVELGLSGDDGVLAPLGHLRNLLAKQGRLDVALGALAERLSSVLLELKDIEAEASGAGGRMHIDPQETERLRERMDLLNRLFQKHRQKEVEGLITLREELRLRTDAMGTLSERIDALTIQESSAHAALQKQADTISAHRVKVLPKLAAQVTGQLHELGMPHAVVVFEHEHKPIGADGIDKVRALFSANKDRPPGPLDKVASGGELSRVMLALIALAAESRQLPTVIFDEIDTGVSGETADRVGTLMMRMAKDRQIIAITHLPQIAGKAHQHLLVAKDHEAEPVSTTITELDAEARVDALARMLSGQRTTKAAIENARELLKGR